MRFMIVDDSPADRELVIRKLRQAFDSAECVEVGRRSDFERALSAETDFDLVLSDYYLHWGDGLEILRVVRSRYPEIPVVMFTDSGNEEVAVAGMKLGLSDYLRKHDLDRLPVAVRESIEKTRLRRKYEESQHRLRLSEERYRVISELVSDYAFSFRATPEGTPVREWTTGAFHRITGYTPEEVDEVGGWTTMLHPDDEALAEAFVRQLLEGEDATASLRIRTRDGETRWLHVTGRPVWDAEENRVIRIFGAAQDVTERRAAQEALVQAEKLALTGTLAASVAHEISNPMQAVIGCLGLADDALPEAEETSEARHYLRIAANEITRAASIVSGLRNLNHPSAPEDRESTDIAALIDDVLALTAGELERTGVQVHREVGRDLSPLMVVPNRLHQVLLNLVLNADHAMRGGGVLTMGAATTTSPDGVVVTVADTGVGISEEHRAQLFRPFFTTKSEGLGLGLYVTRKIVEEHGGTVKIDSEVGVGTTVRIWLPRETDAEAG